jgi:cytochrome c oxidase accessory protein FixG
MTSAAPAPVPDGPIVPKPTGGILPDGRRRVIVPADVHGRFATARRLVFAALIAVYLFLPFWTLAGERAVLFDLGERRFFLFGWRGNAQDLWLTTLVLLGVGWGLVTLTTLLGRAWCGWACPQTVFLDGVFRPIERLVLGKHRDRRGVRHVVAHALYLAVSLALAAVFLRYFARDWSLLALPIGAALYADFAWFREQTCVVVCPYGRLQSALLDDDSLLVGYDARRGEPRGKLGATGAGDCVDCKRCVAVCPTGIDIRDGLQLDCVACTACIDACDEIMDKVGRPRGLVRYDSLRGLRGEPRRFLRPRALLSIAVLVALLVGVAVAAGRRTDFEANLLRLPGLPYTLEGDSVTNRFEVHLVNKRATATTFSVRASAGVDARVIVGRPEIELAPFADRHAPIIVTVPRGAHPALEVRVAAGDEERVLGAPVLGP